ncbi:GntR family transcriptional regulator [Streptomyces sp. L06]|nr:GntR family transcriptional regulator [Streptomyces sp. L06]
MVAQYRAIADDLRKGITTGRYPPGTKLPRQQDIGAEYGVSDITVRKAVEVLRKEGLVESRGRGGHVVRDHPDHASRITRHRQVERDELGYYSGPEVQHWRALPWPGGEQATRIEQATPPIDVAEALGATGRLTVRRRLIGDPGEPTHRQLADSWLPSWITEGSLPSPARPARGHVRPCGGMGRAASGMARGGVGAHAHSGGGIHAPHAGRNSASARRPNHVSAPEAGPDPLTVEVQDIRMSGGLWSLGYPLDRAPSAAWPPAPASSDYYKAPEAPA